ncbi:MAG: hypothetical protein IT204_08395 [Fimbriimonadaceae bacterium]|nr:hypothetical protein [Fimbriimonadaceae bacterium]
MERPADNLATPTAPPAAPGGGAPAGCVVGCGCLAVALLALGVLGLLSGTPPLALVGLIFGGVVALLTGYLAASRRQAATVDVVLQIAPERIRFNDTVKVQLQVTAKRRAPLTTGSIALICRERAINRSGTTDTTYTHVVHQDTQPLEANTVLDLGLTWSAEAAFAVPAGLPASFSGRNNSIEWYVQVHLGLAGLLLDIRETRPVQVRPELA